MRILTIIKHLGPGGTQRAAEIQSISYAGAGHDVAVLATKTGGAREANLREAGLSCFVTTDAEADAKRAVAEAAAWRPDVVHIHRSGHTDRPYLQIIRDLASAIGSRIPAIEISHFGRVDYSPDAELIDAHAHISTWSLWKFNQWARGLNPRPLGVFCPHFVSAEAFFPAGDDARRAFRAEHGLPEDAFVFGRVGQAKPPKWHPIIFDAFRTVAERRPNAWLLLVGAPASYAQHIDAQPEDVRRRIVQPPFLHGDEKLRACYTSMDVFLHAARIGESFGLVFTESLLCGAPIVTLSTPLRDNGQLEVVGHDRGGLVVNDVNSMVQAMETMMDDDALRARLAEQGAAHVREAYDVATRTEHMLRLTELVVEHAGNRHALRSALASDGRFQTDVSWPELRASLDRSIGSPSMLDILKLHVLHRPIVYKWVSRKGTRGR